MKALAIDCAVSKLSISAKNEDKFVSCIYNIGMKQSENIVPAIDYVLKKIELTSSDLDYLTFTKGPGSFTGLRLSISALKAIELAYNKNLYGISSLKTYAFPFFEFDFPILSVIDANKDRFYASIYLNKTNILEDGDYTVDFLLEKLNSFEKILICGPGNHKFKKILEESNHKIKIFSPNFQGVPSEVLFSLIEEEIKNGLNPLNDYDGPLYLRASEAEIVHSQKKS